MTDIHCPHHHPHHHGARPAARPALDHLIPVREYLRATEIPPDGVGAYGIIAFKSKGTSATRSKLMMVCASFIAHFPPNNSIPATVPLSDRMITIWPLDDPEAEKAKADDCDYVVDHFDLYGRKSAIADAELQHADFSGEGPFLIGWSPSNTRGVPNDLVLVVDMSADNTQERIDHDFTSGRTRSSRIRRSGARASRWSGSGSRLMISPISDGSDVIDAIKLVGMKP